MRQRVELFVALRITLTVLAAIPVLSGAAGGQTKLPDAVIRYADIVLFNGKVLTADEKFTIAQAVAIRDGKFLAVGRTQDIMALAGPKTEKIDLSGRSAIPGFVETHLHQAHVGNGATERGRKRLEMATVESAIEELKGEVKGTPPGEWVIVGGPRNQVFYTLNRTQLDAIAPANPLVIINMNEESLANSLGLKALNIPLETPGYIRDPSTGEPTGHLARWASGTMIYERLPWPPMTEEMLTQQKNILKNLHSRGITSLGGRARGLAITIYNTLQRRGELNMRIRVAPEFLRLNGNAEGILKRMGNLVGFGGDFFKIIGATVEPLDGITQDGAALSIQPKIRRSQGDVFGPHGPNLWTDFGPNTLQSTKEQTEWNNIQIAAKYGWNITSMHSTGDKASEILLEAYRDAHRQNPIGEMRFGIDHGLMQSQQNMDMMAEMGIIPSVGMIFQFRKDTIDRLIYSFGADAVHKMTPVKSLINRGIKVVAESDTLEEPFVNPLWQMGKFMTRTDHRGRVWNEQERVSREDVLYMYTSWAARYHWDEKVLGTIEVGKLADVAILGGDYMAVAPEALETMPVEMTILDGKIVYRKGDAGPSMRSSP
jgi:predicted amidohydrolase YtcJ